MSQQKMPPPSLSPLPTAGSSRSPVDHQQQLIEEFEAYPFSDDPDFKAGLPTVISAIRGQKRSAAQIDEMIGRAQWFYFNRLRGTNIPWEVYATYSHSQSSTANVSPSPSSNSPSTSSRSRSSTPAQRPQKDPMAVLNNLAEARRMMSSDNRPSPPGREGESGMSFSMLCALISEGRASEVPGIRQIPDQLNSVPASQSIMPQRPKPWETSRISPPGTSASFTDPPLAPSPSAFDMSYIGDPAFSDVDMNDLLIAGSSNPSPLSFGAPAVSPNVQQQQDFSVSPPSTSTSSHHTSPSQSFANLSFAGNMTAYGGQMSLGGSSIEEQAQGEQQQGFDGYESYDSNASPHIWQPGGGNGSNSGNGRGGGY